MSAQLSLLALVCGMPRCLLHATEADTQSVPVPMRQVVAAYHCPYIEKFLDWNSSASVMLGVSWRSAIDLVREKLLSLGGRGWSQNEPQGRANSLRNKVCSAFSMPLWMGIVSAVSSTKVAESIRGAGVWYGGMLWK